MIALVQGFLLGIVIFFLVGPIFILILEETIKNGRKAALMLTAGLWLSDGAFAIITHFGLHDYLENNTIDYRWGFVTAFILLVVGISSIKTRNKINTQEPSLKFVQSGNLFLKGFLINTFNPFVLIFWLGVAAKVDYDTDFEIQIFYIALFATLISGDLIKIFFSKKISEKLKQKHLANIRAFGGLLLIILSIVMVIRILQQI